MLYSIVYSLDRCCNKASFIEDLAILNPIPVKASANDCATLSIDSVATIVLTLRFLLSKYLLIRLLRFFTCSLYSADLCSFSNVAANS